MRQALQRVFCAVLYVALAIFLALNIWALVSGNYFALFSIGVEVVVLVSVYLGKPWAYIAVRLWACILIVAGALMWLAVFIGGFTYFHTFAHAALETVMLVLGWYFFAYSKIGLRQSGAAI
jgi:hypothetical protein